MSAPVTLTAVPITGNSSVGKTELVAGACLAHSPGVVSSSVGPAGLLSADGFLVSMAAHSIHGASVSSGTGSAHNAATLAAILRPFDVRGTV